jgi:putative flippase GtrA
MLKKIYQFIPSKTKEDFYKFIKYLITGFSSFGIEYICYLFLYTKLHLHYILASIIVYTICFWFSFLINRYWAFNSKGNIKNQLFLYLLLFAFNLVVSNIFIMYLLTNVIGISPLISPFLKAGLVVCWNFYFYKNFIYK